MKRFDVALIVVAAAALGAGLGCASEEPAAVEGGGGAGQVASASAVNDVLNTNCMPCHAGAAAKEELHLDTIEGLMAGSEHGAMVVPGDAAGSQVIKNLRGEDGIERMPYLRDPLSESDIKLIEDWINSGAATS